MHPECSYLYISRCVIQHISDIYTFYWNTSPRNVFDQQLRLSFTKNSQFHIRSHLPPQHTHDLFRIHIFPGNERIIYPNDAIPVLYSGLLRRPPRNDLNH